MAAGINIGEGPEPESVLTRLGRVLRDGLQGGAIVHHDVFFSDWSEKKTS